MNMGHEVEGKLLPCADDRLTARCYIQSPCGAWLTHREQSAGTALLLV